MPFSCISVFLNLLFVISVGRGWGSLAAFNTTLLIIPATRNSVLTLGLGLAFDHVIVYHRFFGRFTIGCVLVHFCFYYNAVETEQFVYLTGFGAMTCALIILATSLDYVRRNYFNVFYWSHYAFVGYFALAYLHCGAARPFIMVGVGLYIVDKLLRVIWQLWPRTLVIFQNKGDSIAHVSRQEENYFIYNYEPCLV